MEEKEAKLLLKKHIFINNKFNTEVQYFYNFDTNAVIFDVGAFKGGWAYYALQKYNCNIYLFEPVKEYYNYCCTRYKSNKNVKIFNYGLEDKNSMLEISLSDEGSSLYRNNGKKELIEIKKISDVIQELNIKTIDLLKLNIEGGEYKLIDNLSENDLLKNIKHLQIQFHSDMDKDGSKRDKAIELILKTHKIDKIYKYCWEFFSLI